MSTATPEGDTRNWFVRHKILTVILTVFGLGVIGTAFAEEEGPADPQSESPTSSDSSSDDSDDTDGSADSPSASDDPSAKPKPSRQTKPPETPSTTEPPPPERRRPVRYLVTEVVDGDTVKVAKGGETSIRIIGIDTPETVHPFEPVECGGPQASKTAAALLTGKRVQLVYDPSQGRLDTYDRTLAYVTVPGLGDFGLAMLRRGQAAEYTYDTAYAKQSLYLQAESRAQSLNKGVWDRCGGVDAPLEQPTPEPTPPPEPPPTEDPEDPAPNSDCAAGYSPCVPPYPPDLDCGDVEAPITVTGDRHAW